MALTPEFILAYGMLHSLAGVVCGLSALAVFVFGVAADMCGREEPVLLGVCLAALLLFVASLSFAVVMPRTYEICRVYECPKAGR